MITKMHICPICDVRPNESKELAINIMGISYYLWFHKECWKQAGGGDKTVFTEQQWLEFAGKEYEVDPDILRFIDS